MFVRVVRFLRSRKWAVRLLAVITVYCAVVTALPQRDAASDEVAAWAPVAAWGAANPELYSVTSALGLHTGFDNPFLIGLSVWLALATTACAWERTARAFAERRRGASVPAATLERLRHRPRIVVPVPPGLDTADTLSRARSAVESLGMRTETGSRLLSGRGRALGLIGSPLLHWSLVFLFMATGVGQLSRSEGLVGVVTGSSMPDVEASYRMLERGPLHPELSGLDIAVTKMDHDYTEGGVEYGPTPFVELRDGDQVVASGWVRPNAPLRHRAMMIHGLQHGLAVVADIDDGAGRLTREVLLDYDPASATGVIADGFIMEGAQGATAVVFDLPAGDSADTAAPSVKVRWGPEGLAELPMRAELGLGESIEVDGVRVGVSRLTTYARLSVVDDWSVPWIYLFLTLAIVGSGMAVLLPARAVWVLLTRDDDMALHVEVRHARGDPLWPERVTEALVRALGEEKERSHD